MAEKQSLYFLDNIITEGGRELYTNKPVERSKPSVKNAYSTFTLNKNSKRIYGELCGVSEETVDKFSIHVSCDGTSRVHVSAKYGKIEFRYGNGTIPPFSVKPANASYSIVSPEIMECFLETIFNDVMQNNSAQICGGKNNKKLQSDLERYKSVNHNIVDLADDGKLLIEGYTPSPRTSPPTSPNTGGLEILNLKISESDRERQNKERHKEIQKLLRERRKNVGEMPEIEKKYIQLHNMKKDPSLKNEYQTRYTDFMTLYTQTIKKGEYVPEYIIDEIRRDPILKSKYAEAQKEIMKQMKYWDGKKQKFLNIIEALDTIEKEGKESKRKHVNEYLDSLIPLAKRIGKDFVPVYLDSTFTENTDISIYIKNVEFFDLRIVETYKDLLLTLQSELARISNEISDEITENTFEMDDVSQQIRSLLDLLQDSKDDYSILFGSTKKISEIEKLQQRFDLIKSIEDKTQEQQQLMWTFFNLYFKMKNENEDIPEYIDYYMKNEPRVELYIKVMQRMTQERLKKTETESRELLKQLKANQSPELKEKYKEILQVIMKDKTRLEKITKNLVTVSSFGKRSNHGLLRSLKQVNADIRYLTMTLCT